MLQYQFAAGEGTELRRRNSLFNKIHRLCLLLAAVLCFVGLSCPVYAKTKVETDENCTIRIQYQAADTEFSIYRVADITEEYRFAVTGEFAAYPVDFQTLESEEWKELAETLAAYVKRDQLKPLRTGVTDQHGTLMFDDLPVGVYLVIGEQTREEDVIYRCKAFLAFVPLETETGEWDYEPEYIPKFSENPVGLEDRTVMKIWKDEGHEKDRPKEIWVQLLKNGIIQEETVLNEKNNWMHTWKDLSSEDSWQIVEKNVPEDHTVSISEEGTLIRVVNTWTGEQTKQPDQPEKLPQTGQLWWPVPLLAAMGLLCFLIGLIRRRMDHES